MNIDEFNRIIGIDDSYKAPEKIMGILMEGGERRSDYFQAIISADNDLSHDTLQSYYEDEQALRGQHKQDYTLTSVSRLTGMLTGDANGTVYDPTAGTGSMIISRWWQDYVDSGMPWEYRPCEHMYVCQELSDRAIPFLLTNLMLRGMNAAVIHGDTLTMSDIKGVFFVQNDAEDALAFSNLNVMPYSDEVRAFFNIHSWAPESERYEPHMESPPHIWLTREQAERIAGRSQQPTHSEQTTRGKYVQDAITD